ncbi:hypothetical protein As57867_016535, partial [Aphanomyces stellatus]
MKFLAVTTALSVIATSTLGRSIADWQVCHSRHDSCSSPSWQCCVAVADCATKKHTCRPASECNHCKKSPPRPSTQGRTFAGANSFFLHTLNAPDRLEVLDELKASGFQVVRIFLSSIGGGAKGANSIGVNDLEQDAVGRYDDSILSLVDQLMLDCVQRGLKLVVALHDRYS